MAAFKVGARVKVSDHDSEYYNQQGEIKSAAPTNATPPAGHTGRIWNVRLDGRTDEIKFDEAHMTAVAKPH